MIKKVAATAFLTLLAVPAFSQVLCSQTGAVPESTDTSLAPKIADWVSKVETNLGLTVPDGTEKLAATGNSREDALLALQARTQRWVDAAEPSSVDAIFRQAVGHGVNVQYETFMIGADPANAKTHQFWVAAEAARADACLSLIRRP